MMLKNSKMDNARLALKLLLLTSYIRNSRAQQQLIGNQSQHSDVYRLRAAADACCPVIYDYESCYYYGHGTPDSALSTETPVCLTRDVMCPKLPYDLTYPDGCDPPPPIDCGYPQPPECPTGATWCYAYYKYKANNKWRCPRMELHYDNALGYPAQNRLSYTQTKPECHEQSLQPITSCMSVRLNKYNQTVCLPIGGDAGGCGGYDCEGVMYEVEGCKCDAIPRYYCPWDNASTCTITYEYRPHYGCCPAVVMRVLSPGGNTTEQRAEPKDYIKECIAGTSALGVPQLTVLLIAARLIDTCLERIFTR